jgi:hypothetical protein
LFEDAIYFLTLCSSRLCWHLNVACAEILSERGVTSVFKLRQRGKHHYVQSWDGHLVLTELPSRPSIHLCYSASSQVFFFVASVCFPPSQSSLHHSAVQPSNSDCCCRLSSCIALCCSCFRIAPPRMSIVKPKPHPPAPKQWCSREYYRQGSIRECQARRSGSQHHGPTLRERH